MHEALGGATGIGARLAVDPRNMLTELQLPVLAYDFIGGTHGSLLLLWHTIVCTCEARPSLCSRESHHHTCSAYTRLCLSNQSR